LSLVIDVVVAAWFTVCSSTALVDAALFVSPPYDAVKWCVPAFASASEHCPVATLELQVAVTSSASVIVTVPVGVPYPVTMYFTVID
jgi:hypothetical protein